MRLCIALLGGCMAVALGAGPAGASEEDPPNRTGCCASFDNSPVTLVFCMTEHACTLEPKP